MPESGIPESEAFVTENFPEAKETPVDWSKQPSSDAMLLRGLLKKIAERDPDS